MRNLLKDVARRNMDLEVKVASQSSTALPLRTSHSRRPSLSVDTTGRPSRDTGSSTPTPTTASMSTLPPILEHTRGITLPLNKSSRVHHRKEDLSPDVYVSDVSSPDAQTPKSANNANRKAQVSSASPLSHDEINGIHIASTPLFSAAFGGSLPANSPADMSPGMNRRPMLNRSASSVNGTKKSSTHDTCLQVLPAAVSPLSPVDCLRSKLD